ncbi:amino acid dehydrogenase [Endozoicomonas montiporae]|uniref:Amino acid dehydrogenase n=2 Tax=Endozoicomonas montiporae TaxID=1027273 RepID=A0A081N1N7_9GAMM|nr:Glu/Leu/Phe/Val dehydrogenase dimerization domain-containing protein [Endozoicomonas montiporae]AMO58706.1 glutamate dehydrogenase/leucine dehydrogenase [Endozoicomonas montiporae CL-33]KEQ12360.1 amino acid dehydrogenase [Endozoicomonas montiporae]
MFRQIAEARMNDIHIKHDEHSGLKSIIAIHNTRRGPSLGGCRFIPYPSFDDAVTDAIRLAQGMSYKAALAGLDLGGGKSVIMMPEGDYDRTELFSAFGRFVEELGGRYITAMDSGTRVSDMDVIASQTRHVTCTSSSGNPAPSTAKGVYYGILSTLKAHKEFGSSLKGMTIAVQGLGNVGYALCQLLHRGGAKLIVSDIDEARIEQCIREFGAKAVSPEAIHSTPCDIFSPCGLGGILNEETIDQLQCGAVAGSANNQLLTPECGEQLFKRDILYAPDYLINAGGLIFVAMAYSRKSHHELNLRIKSIGETLLQIFRRQQQQQEPVNRIADQMAEAMLFGDELRQLSA